MSISDFHMHTHKHMLEHTHPQETVTTDTFITEKILWILEDMSITQSFDKKCIYFI